MNKKKILLLSLASLLLVSCGTKHLTKEEALLRAETMKEKVENGEVTSPSKFVYTEEMAFDQIDKEYYVRNQILADYDSNYYVKEGIHTIICANGNVDVKETISNCYYLFIQDNQLIYAKTTFLSKEYMVLYEGTSSSDTNLIEEMKKYREQFVIDNFIINESIAHYDLSSHYDVDGFKSLIPIEYVDRATCELSDSASYTSDSDLYVESNIKVSKESFEIERKQTYNFTNYLISSVSRNYVATIDGKVETYDYNYLLQSNVAYNRVDLSTFEKVDKII